MKNKTYYRIMIGNNDCWMTETFDTYEDAVIHAKKIRKKGDEYDDYWNKKTHTIQKITTEDVAIITENDKETMKEPQPTIKNKWWKF